MLSRRGGGKVHLPQGGVRNTSHFSAHMTREIVYATKMDTIIKYYNRNNCFPINRCRLCVLTSSFPYPKLLKVTVASRAETKIEHFQSVEV